MSLYNDRQSRIAHSFVHSSTMCQIECACKRVHFTSARGHGDYSDGELEQLQALAIAEPDKYLEDSEYDSIDYMHDGSDQVVIHCPCGRAERIAKWLEAHAEDVASYLRLYFQEAIKDSARQEKRARNSMADLDGVPQPFPLVEPGKRAMSL